MFQFFIKNKLIGTKQSGFKPGVSCIKQLLSIGHDIYKLFDEGYEVRGVFLDTCDALRDLVIFVQFKKREKHPWRSVNFSKVAG